jgi:DNA repair exonuclease SbcCD ATPase subunit
MIQSVEIKNFQSHKHTVIDFTKGVNVVTGSSDSGKSAIIRAMKWVLFNRPRGDGFRSHWGGDTSVTITTTEGNTVTRIKTDTENFYDLNGQVFKALGADVPEEVQQVLNIEDLNLQQQIDPPFLFTLSPGQVATHFNQMANIEDIDIVTKKIKNTLNAVARDAETSKTQVKQKKNELKKYAFLPELEESVLLFEKQEQASTQLNSDAIAIQGYITSITGLQQQIKQKKQTTSALPDIEQIIYQFQKQNKTAEQIQLIQQRINSIEQLQLKIKEAKKRTKALPDIEQILQQYDLITEIDDSIVSLQNAELRINKTSKSLKHSKEKLEQLEQQWHDNFPDQCPLCGAVQNNNKA